MGFSGQSSLLRWKSIVKVCVWERWRDGALPPSWAGVDSELETRHGSRAERGWARRHVSPLRRPHRPLEWSWVFRLDARLHWYALRFGAIGHVSFTSRKRTCSFESECISACCNEISDQLNVLYFCCHFSFSLFSSTEMSVFPCWQVTPCPSRRFMNTRVRSLPLSIL